MSEEFVKTGRLEALEFEVAGIKWLADAEETGGAKMVEVRGLSDAGLALTRLEDGFASAPAARAFGAALARTHAAGAPGWGAAPPTWTSPQANKGMMPMSVVPAGEKFQFNSFGQWLVSERLQPVVEAAATNGDLPAEDENRFERLYQWLLDGDFDSPQPRLVKDPAARLHGDLWSGNLMWGPSGVVLIDPTSYGGHAETDLAECGLFGTPYMKDIYAGYNSVSPLAHGWEDRVALHRLYMLTLHLALFGAGYLRSVQAILERYV